MEPLLGKLGSAAQQQGNYAGFGFPDLTLPQLPPMPFAIANGPPQQQPSIDIPGVNISTKARGNKYVGLPGFESIPAALVLMINKNDARSASDARELSVGQIMMRRSNKDAVLRKHKPSNTVNHGTNSVEAKSLSALNNYLRTRPQAFTSAQDVADECWRHWT